MYEEVTRPSSKAVLYQTLDVIDDSLSEQAFDRAAKWLSYCLDHDKECAPPNSDFMPRRLLNVGSLDGTSEPFLFEPAQTSPYVCLSYCWGTYTGDVIKTTRSNLDSHYQCIPAELLPRTIYDAVILCRGLKIQNLWVDSLCIIQDDINSWLHESGQMRDIYLNSCFTIAAEEPASCKLGFLGKQRFGSPEWQQRFTTNVPIEVGGPGKEIFIRPKDVHSREKNERCSLDKRGWCLQESILPNRRLCFNGNEMIWECLCRKICDCGHTLWIPEPARYRTLGVSIKSGSSQPYENWRSLVEEYSDRSLTHKTDKLSAISGLAKMIDRSLHDAGASDIYLAGLWKREFVSDLTWRVVSFEPDTQDNRQYRAPSWSWASVNGSVRYEFRERVSLWKYSPTQEMHCTVDEVVCHNVLPSDPTGLVTAAYAVMKGPLAAVELVVLDEALSETWQSSLQREECRTLPSNQRSLVRSKNLKSLEVHLDFASETTLRSGAEQSDCWIQGSCGQQSCLCEIQDLASHPENGKPCFYCFRLFTWRATGSLDDSGKGKVIPPETWYLVLRRSSLNEDTFERIGVGVWTSQYHQKSLRQNNCPLFDECELATVKIV